MSDGRLGGGRTRPPSATSASGSAAGSLGPTSSIYHAGSGYLSADEEWLAEGEAGKTEDGPRHQRNDAGWRLGDVAPPKVLGLVVARSAQCGGNTGACVQICPRVLTRPASSPALGRSQQRCSSATSRQLLLGTPPTRGTMSYISFCRGLSASSHSSFAGGPEDAAAATTMAAFNVAGRARPSTAPAMHQRRTPASASGNRGAISACGMYCPRPTSSRERWGGCPLEWRSEGSTNVGVPCDGGVGPLPKLVRGKRLSK